VNVAAAAALQKRYGMTDEAFAFRVGLHEKSWNRIKNGHVPLCKRRQEVIMRAFPELEKILPSGCYYSNITPVPEGRDGDGGGLLRRVKTVFKQG
jgi:hypothetical protein